MALIKEQNVLETMRSNENIRGIRIQTTSSNFESRYNGNVHNFFKTLKNSLQSVNGLSNRKYFKNFSGTYFFLDDGDETDIIILYDSSISNYTELQMRIRLRKLLGNNVSIEFGDVFAFADRLHQMTQIVRKFQTFGTYYSNSEMEN